MCVCVFVCVCVCLCVCVCVNVCVCVFNIQSSCEHILTLMDKLIKETRYTC